MRPNVILKRCNIEIAYHNLAACFGHFTEPIGHFGQKFELVIKFLVNGRVRLVAACGHIKIVHRERASVALKGHVLMAGILLAAKGPLAGLYNGMARNCGNPVIGLLPAHMDVGIARRADFACGKLIVLTLNLLKAQQIWLIFRQQALNQIQAKPHRIDVPGDKLECHEAFRRWFANRQFAC